MQLTDKAVYINGKQADMNWRYRYSINYTRNQEVDTSPMTMINKSFYKNGTYSGPQNVKSDDCIEVKMTGFSYMYFHNNLNTGEYEFYYIKPSEMIASGYYSFYVDVNTGKAIDTEWNWYARKLKMPQDLK